MPIPQFFDNHKIDESFQKLKHLILKMEVDIYSFIGPKKNHSAAKRAGRALRKCRKLAKELNVNILNQVQDQRNEY